MFSRMTLVVMILVVLSRQSKGFTLFDGPSVQSPSNFVTRKEVEARDNRNHQAKQVNEHGAELSIPEQDNNKGSTSVTTFGDVTKKARNDCNQETVNETVVDLTLSPKDEGSTSLDAPVSVTKEAETQNSLADKEIINEIVIDLTILSLRTTKLLLLWMLLIVSRER